MPPYIKRTIKEWAAIAQTTTSTEQRLFCLERIAVQSDEELAKRIESARLAYAGAITAPQGIRIEIDSVDLHAWRKETEQREREINALLDEILL